MATPCPGDCASQRYPSFPYDDGAESLFAKVLPIILSAIVVVISWLAGRFIDSIEVSAPGSMHRTKSGTIGQSVKRSASHEKAADFHSSARSVGKVIGGVQEMEGIEVTDDENRLYNEQYGSEHSQEDGDRYDALGDSPGAQGPSSQGPRSPSVYSQFSQSVFSQSAYGPSAYGPSQRRMAGSTYGHSQYDNASSMGGSQYPGPVPSHFGASQLSEATSYQASGSGPIGVHGAHGGVVYGNGSGPIHYGRAMMPQAARVPAPAYNPHAPRTGLGGAGSGAATAAATAAAAAAAAAVLRDGAGYNRGSPPPYSHAQMISAPMPASVLPAEPRPSIDANAQPPALNASGGFAEGGDAEVSGVANPVAASQGATAPPTGIVPRGRAGRVRQMGPKSGFGSDSDGGESAVPSSFRP